jgi:hypothetical protein
MIYPASLFLTLYMMNHVLLLPGFLVDKYSRCWLPTTSSSSSSSSIGCSSTMSSSQLTACLRDLVGHFKTDPTETVALSFGCPKTQYLRYCVNVIDEEGIIVILHAGASRLL